MSASIIRPTRAVLRLLQSGLEIGALALVIAPLLWVVVWLIEAGTTAL